MKKPSSFGIWGNTDKESFWETLPTEENTKKTIKITGIHFDARNISHSIKKVFVL